MRHFLKITDLTSEEIDSILNRADELQACWQNNAMPGTLEGKRVALWFHGDGFRNRLAFELGIRALGGEVSHLPGVLGVNEPIDDIGHYLENWFSMLIVRADSHARLEQLSSDLHIPIINARTNLNHPCEILGDLHYIRSKRGSLDGLRVVFVGEVTNLCMSWFEAAVRLPISVVQVAPDDFMADLTVLERMRADAIGEIFTTNDLLGSMNNNIDVLYTDCWPGRSNKMDIETLFTPYQVSETVLSRMNQFGFFLPCPPVSRGEEVSAGAMNSPLCKNYEAKAHLLHVQNALIEYFHALTVAG